MTADMTEETFTQVMDVNLKSVFLFAKYAVPALTAGGGGVMVNVASTAGLVGTALGCAAGRRRNSCPRTCLSR